MTHTTLTEAFDRLSVPDFIRPALEDAIEARDAARLAERDHTLTELAAIHRRIPIRPWAEDCGDEDHTHDPDDLGVADVCYTCPPTGEAVCGHCWDGDGGDPYQWPCPTMRVVLDGQAPTQATEEEEWTEQQIRRAYDNHASPDDWSVPSFYVDGLLAALAGEYDDPPAPVPARDTDEETHQ